ncbi:MAG: LPS export ABC transporter permease LptF [Proteobacteria bacterium]|nr:LPS export ABC transporter permease LptF [Pseudomonadota bacterium]
MVLDRYLLREIGASFAAVAAALTVVFLAYSLTRFLTDAAGGLLRADEVALLTLYKSIIALEVLLPLALYFGLIVGFSRLNSHAELTAMQACGYGRRRLQRPLFLCSLLLATAVGAFSFTVRPWAYSAMFELKAQADASSELDRIKAQRFYLYDANNRAVYVEHISRDGRALSGVFIRERRGEGVVVMSAPSGTVHPFATPDRHRLTLADASIYKNVAGDSDCYGNFATLTRSIKAARTLEREYRTKSEPTAALLLSHDPQDRAELQWRLSTALSTLLLALVALGLAETRPRQSRFARLPIAIGVYAIYYNLLGLGRTWVEHQWAPSIWWVPALLAAALLVIWHSTPFARSH